VPERTCPQVYKIGMPNAVIGFDQNGQMWMDQGVDARSMDPSAVQGVDGWGSSCAALGNLLLAQAEDAESRFPIININREMVTDKGGPGQWRGQPGSLNVKQILEPTFAMAWMVSMAHPLRGLCGGEDACSYGNTFEVGSPNERKIALIERAQLPAGAVIAYQHGGGAGFGPALQRDPQAVRDDVLDEKVSIAAARDKYGVVLTGTLENYDLQVDVAATDALRKKMKAAQTNVARAA
jgi:N-methylhydantoinase B